MVECEKYCDTAEVSKVQLGLSSINGNTILLECIGKYGKIQIHRAMFLPLQRAGWVATTQEEVNTIGVVGPLCKVADAQ
jgi:hypothetical protein